MCVCECVCVYEREREREVGVRPGNDYGERVRRWRQWELLMRMRMGKERLVVSQSISVEPPEMLMPPVYVWCVCVCGVCVCVCVCVCVSESERGGERERGRPSIYRCGVCARARE